MISLLGSSKFLSRINTLDLYQKASLLLPRAFVFETSKVKPGIVNPERSISDRISASETNKASHFSITRRTTHFFAHIFLKFSINKNNNSIRRKH